MQNPHIATEISSGYTNLIISITAKSLKLKTQLATWLRWYGNVWMISLPSVQGHWQGFGRIYPCNKWDSVWLAGQIDWTITQDEMFLLFYWKNPITPQKHKHLRDTPRSGPDTSHVLSYVECRAARVMSFIIRLSSARRQDLFLSEINISFAPVACNRVSGDG